MCVRHLYDNLKKKHGGKPGLKAAFWGIARSYNEPDLNAKLEELHDYQREVYHDIMVMNPRNWSRAFMAEGSCCDEVNNNFVESFNHTIVPARRKPMMEMLEIIRRQAMVRISKRSAEANSWTGIHTQYAQKCLQLEEEPAKLCVSFAGTDGWYEVNDGQSHSVNLRKRTCSCRKWQLTGIPCCHAFSVITSRGMKVEDYISEYFIQSRLRATYKRAPLPLNGEKFWTKTPGATIVPPLDRIMPGRPGRPRKFARIKGRHESPTKNKKVKLSRRGGIVRCRKCGQTGHNSITCERRKKQAEGGSSQVVETLSQSAPAPTQPSQRQSPPLPRMLPMEERESEYACF